MARKNALTPKQERFVAEYLVDLNATQAAIRAGYSKRTADRIGPELLGKTWVSRAIEEARAKQQIRIQITADDVLRDLLEVKSRCMVKGPDFDSKGANRALELIGKHLGMFTDKHELTVEGDASLLLAAKRAVSESK